MNTNKTMRCPTSSNVLATIPKNSREAVVISLDKFQQQIFVSIRVWAIHSDTKEAVPTPKGITFALPLLSAVIAALQKLNQQTNG